MNTKDYLNGAFWLNQRINSDIRELDELKELVTGINAVKVSERVKVTPSGEAPFVRNIEKIMVLEDKIDQEIDEYVDLKDEIRTLIDRVKDQKLQLVLRYRYIHFCRWDEVADMLGFTLRWTHILHQRALEEVSKIISEKN